MFLYQITCNGACQASQSKYKLPATYPLEHNTQKPNLISVLSLGMINAHSSESNILELMLQHSYPVMVKTQWYFYIRNILMCFVTQHMVKVFQFPGQMVCVCRSSSCTTAFISYSMLHFPGSEMKPTPIVLLFFLL